MSEEIPTLAGNGTSSPSSDKLITTEELPAAIDRKPVVTQEDPITQEDLVGSSASDAAAAAPSLLNQPPAEATTTTTTQPAETIECPRPADVLMPVEGYQLWAGNVRYLQAVANTQPEFLQAVGRSEQARIALDIVHAVQQAGGRFLTAIDVPVTTDCSSSSTLPNNSSSIVRTTAWELMKETDVLIRLGKALRTPTTVDVVNDEEKQRLKKEKKRRRKEKKRKRKERRRARRRERALVVPASDEEQQQQILPSAMGALQSLYYVPSYYPVAEDRSKGSIEYESDSLSSSSSSSSEEEAPSPPPAKKKRVVRKSTTTTTRAPAAAAKKPAPTTTAAAATAPTTTEKKREISFHYKPKPMKSQQAAFEHEGELNLPKGVTVRPSGKWQAQTYFAGQSRYVGVYDTSRLAARAYVVVQDYLRQYRADNRITKDSPKEELAMIFANARRAADDAVRDLNASIVNASTVPQQQETQLGFGLGPMVAAMAAPEQAAVAPSAEEEAHTEESPSQPTNITTI